MATPPFTDGFPNTALEAINFSYFLTNTEKEEWREWIQTATEAQKDELIDILHSMWQDNQKTAVPQNFTQNTQPIQNFTPNLPQPPNPFDQSQQVFASNSPTNPFINQTQSQNQSNPFVQQTQSQQQPNQFTQYNQQVTHNLKENDFNQFVPNLNPQPNQFTQQNSNYNQFTSSPSSNPFTDANLSTNQPNFSYNPSVNPNLSNSTQLDQTPENPFINTVNTFTSNKETSPTPQAPINPVGQTIIEPVSTPPTPSTPAFIDPVTETKTQSQFTDFNDEPFFDTDFKDDLENSSSNSKKSLKTNTEEKPQDKDIIEPIKNHNDEEKEEYEEEEDKKERQKDKAKKAKNSINYQTLTNPSKNTYHPSSVLDEYLNDDSSKFNFDQEDGDKDDDSNLEDEEGLELDFVAEKKPKAETSKLDQKTEKTNPKKVKFSDIQNQNDESEEITALYQNYLDSTDSSNKRQTELLKKISTVASNSVKINNYLEELTRQIYELNQKLVFQAKKNQALEQAIGNLPSDLTISEALEEYKLEIQELQDKLTSSRVSTRKRIEKLESVIAGKNNSVFDAEERLELIELDMLALKESVKQIHSTKSTISQPNYQKYSTLEQKDGKKQGSTDGFNSTGKNTSTRQKIDLRNIL